MTLNLKFDLDPPFFRENECHHGIPRGWFSLKKVCLLLLLIVPFIRHLSSTITSTFFLSDNVRLAKALYPYQ